MTRAGFGLWLVAGGLASWLVQAHDARIAVGVEILVPAAVFLLHMAMGGAWWLIARKWLGVPAGVVLVAWAWLVPTAPSPAERVEPGEGPDIVVVTLDTFRADHLREDWTPVLWELGQSGGHYTQAVSTAPLTGPAHASMWTGLEVRDHGLLANGRQVTEETVVPDVRARGYRTGAFLSAHVLDRATGLDDGWDHYDDRWGWRQRADWMPWLSPVAMGARTRRGDETVERALTWLGESDDPALLWVHLYDAHGPYVTPAEFRPSDEALEKARRLDQASLSRRDGQPMGLVDLLHAARPAQQGLQYRAGVRYVDHLVGALLDGLAEDTRILVVGDHGESLDEHDYFFNHGAKLYEPSMAVPFVGRGPGLDGSDRLVSVQSVAAIVDAWSQGQPAPDLEVREVVGYTTGQQARKDLPKPGEERERAAMVRVDGAKLVQHGAGPAEWFDLLVDPDELTPLPVPASMGPWLDRLDEAIDQEPPALSDEERLKLEALGYVE